MKHILVIYILLEIMAGCYLYTQLGDSFFQHLVMTIPAVILYVAACFKNVTQDPLSLGTQISKTSNWLTVTPKSTVVSASRQLKPVRRMALQR